MAAANPQPLRVRCPFVDDYVQIPAIHVDDGDEDEEDVHGDAMNEAENAGGTFANASEHRRGGGGVFAASRTGELTLAFEGELFVFPAVTPEKVQAVLLLLGGCKLPTAASMIDVPFDRSNRGVNDSPKCSNLSRRIASLVRFREKRKGRCFEKKIRYSVRKEVAQRMHRKNGQFASVKENSGSSSLDSAKSGDQGDGKPPVTIPCRCQHCGVGEYSTPAMRRGPAGPRTLCNACGLIWANKGTLRDLKRGAAFTLDQLKPVTPPDIKPPNMEGENFCGDLDDAGLSEDPFKAITGPSSNPSINQDEEDMYGFSSVHSAMSSEIGAVDSSRDFDEQGSFVEFANSSENDMDIHANFI